MKNLKITRTLIRMLIIAGILTVMVGGSTGSMRALAFATQPQAGSPRPEQPLAPVISIDPAAINSTQTTELVTVPMTITNSGDADLDWVLSDAFTEIPWSDNFDSYATGSSMHGQGGWKGWDNNPLAEAFTTDVQARSAPNSVEIVDDSDLVHEYSGYTTGSWTYTAWQYIPSAFTGETYFILLNTYNDLGPYNWSVQVDFNGDTSQVVNTGISGGSLAMVRDQWVEIRVEIDLTADTTSFYYNDQLLYSGTWTEEVSGGGVKNIAAVDLWGNFSAQVYYDDISLGHLVDIPWLSTNPTSGTTGPGADSPVDVFLDATTLSLGVYTATLYASSNDPVTPIVSVPVTMTVLAEADLGITKSDSADPVFTGELITYTLTVGNTGPDDVVDVTVVDTLPAGVIFGSASPGCAEVGGVVTCDIDLLEAGSTTTLNIYVTAPLVPGSITNTATVNADVIDPNPTNNSDAEDTMVQSSVIYSFLPIIFK
ncbi:MAG: hypothetical protein A2136_04830 [Chloroflexi bacterium RBG_16_54_11]|nr:MAG: hypothetical protein A2136_04830 [Chloroflexi bacterium RBG_16_54_11]